MTLTRPLVRKLPPLHHEFHLKSSSLLPVPRFTGKVKCWLLWVVIAQRHSGWSHFLCFLKFPPAWLWAVQDKDGLHSFCCSWCLAQSMTPKSCSRQSEIINHFALLIVSQFQCYYLEIHILSGNEAIKKKNNFSHAVKMSFSQFTWKSKSITAGRYSSPLRRSVCTYVYLGGEVQKDELWVTNI